MGQKGERGDPGSIMDRGIIFGDPSMTAPPSGSNRPGEGVTYDFKLILVSAAKKDVLSISSCPLTT
jgi:hypothetical protein